MTIGALVMARRRPRRKPLGTIWAVPDELWEGIEPILREFWPKKPTGRRVANWRTMLNAIIFRMRTGCQWEQLPERFGPKSTVPDWFQRGVGGGIFEKSWAVWPPATCPRMVPGVGRGWHLREDVGGAGRRVRRTRRGPVAMAECRRD